MSHMPAKRFPVDGDISLEKLGCRILLHGIWHNHWNLIQHPMKKQPSFGYSLQVSDMKIDLPQLCLCHNLHPLDPKYPYNCAQNCPLFWKPEAHRKMLNSLLLAYNVLPTRLK